MSAASTRCKMLVKQLPVSSHAMAHTDTYCTASFKLHAACVTCTAACISATSKQEEAVLQLRCCVGAA